jgi:hypothetical protein
MGTLTKIRHSAFISCAYLRKGIIFGAMNNLLIFSCVKIQFLYDGFNGIKMSNETWFSLQHESVCCITCVERKVGEFG